MGYLTRLGAGAADRPIQAAQEPRSRPHPWSPACGAGGGRAGAAQGRSRANLQTRQRAVKPAGGAMRATATANGPVVKAAASALRGAVSGTRAAMAPLAAGGGAVIAMVLVLCLVAALVMSPMGIFFSGEEAGRQTIAGAIHEINQEYSAKLEEIEAGTAHHRLEFFGTRAPWPEVLAVYAAKTTSDPTNGQEVVSMTNEKRNLLKQWDMNEVSSFTGTVPGERDEEDTTTLHITVTAKTADEMADIYGFNASQRQQSAGLLSHEYRGLRQDRSYTPNPGDIIFFDWHDPDGFSGPQDGGPGHVGIVEKVENGRVYTIEGNSGDKCCQRGYPVAYYEIYGYGVSSK